MFEKPQNEAAWRWPEAIPAHPRLLASSVDWPRLREQVKTDRPSLRLWQTLLRRADAICTEPVLERRMTGRLLLMVSRQALERISVLALVCRVSEEAGYGHRAIHEMRALCSFVDWNPGHFLDTAELSLAVSIGYDWLNDMLLPNEADTIARALLTKGIEPSLDAGAASNWWLEADENWVQVCHGGLAASAIALADRHPALAQRIIRRAVTALPGVAKRYGPDGAYPEGPMYWSYGTAYHVVLAAGLQRFIGSTLGVDAYEGFAQSADYINHVTAPSGHYFNYADCASGRRLQAQLFWMAGRFKRPDWLAHDIATLERDLGEYEAEPGVQYWYYDMVALALLWYRPMPTPQEAQGSFWTANGPVPVACYRGEHQSYLAIKGGAVGLSHSHMDVGAFIFEVGGERWAVDPGMQDYESLESAGVDLWNETRADSQRWTVFRIGAESHNIVRFNGAPQPLYAPAGMRATAAECSIDLTTLYPVLGGSAERQFRPTPRGMQLVDRWHGDEQVLVSSQWLTTAEIEQSGSTLILRQGNRALRLDISGTEISAIDVEDCSAPARAYDASNPSLTRITIRSRLAAAGRICVTATLLS